MGCEQSKESDPALPGSSQQTRRSSAHERAINIQLLSTKEKHMIKHHWIKSSNDHKEYFVNVFLNILHSSPKVGQIFGLKGESTTSRENIMHNKRFQRAITGMTLFFEKVIIGCGVDEERTCGLSLDLGAKHSDYYDSGFKGVYFDLFSVALVEEFEKMTSKNAPDSQLALVIAWRKLIRIIVSQMQESYNDVRRYGDYPAETD